MVAKEDGPYRWIYAVVVPRPGGSSKGIERVPDGTLPDKFLFWFKLGDTAQDDPTKRTKAYGNPDQGLEIIRFKDAKQAHKDCDDAADKNGKKRTHPAKQLEITYLKGLEQGGLGQARSSEWHALYAKDESDALTLSKALQDFLAGFEQPCTYEELSDQVDKLRNNRAISDSKSDDDYGKPIRGGNVNDDLERWELIITPSVDQAANNLGIDGEYWLTIDITSSKRREASEVIRTEWITEMPDLSYGLRTVTASESGKTAGDIMVEFKNELTSQNAGIVLQFRMKGTWLGVRSLIGKTEELRQLLLKTKNMFNSG